MPHRLSKTEREALAKRKIDALALAELAYDLFKAKKAGGKIDSEKYKNGV